MKKAILPAMIAALLATSAQAATVYDADGTTADVYGRMQFNITDDGTGATDGVGSARLGFKAASPINSHVNAIAKGEWQIASETSNNDTFKVRELYAGFDGEMGSLVFGQTFTAFYQTAGVTDYFNSNGFKAIYNNIDPYRQEGQAVYSGEFSGVSVGASTQFQKVGYTEDDDGNSTSDLDNGYALSLGYDIADVTVSAGYLLEQFDTLEDKKNYALSATYAMNDLYLAAVYAMSEQEVVGDDDNDFTAYDLLASYALANDVQLLAGYGFEENTVTNEDTVDEVTLSAQYLFNNQLKTWIEYKADMITDADDAVTVALQYNF
ncbi:porin [Psychromonas sp. MB-3u-54]|uniref:porin n=1 Tax=Psychromonas sp. MB-3u-54 TaxID=2058319 RepID=UPI000C341260|nr:porin [Psychromonas sp. MB-3u-54]PKH02858.1 porin [Psychromonas sp. MB-3u-54]